ncbi:Uncharacterised protein [Vibrio cholerae]|nr:Uncharacterised protein [Vibrio cholerae]
MTSTRLSGPIAGRLLLVLIRETILDCHSREVNTCSSLKSLPQYNQLLSSRESRRIPMAMCLFCIARSYSHTLMASLGLATMRKVMFSPETSGL